MEYITCLFGCKVRFDSKSIRTHIEDHHKEIISPSRFSIPRSVEQLVIFLNDNIFLIEISTLKYELRIIVSSIEKSIRPQQYFFNVYCQDLFIVSTNSKDIVDYKIRNKLLNLDNLITLINLEKVIDTYELEMCVVDQVKSKLQFNPKTIQEFYCRNCKNSLRPPVFLCETGHSICCHCKKSKKCEDCQSTIENIRNYSLEGIVQEYFSYECVNNIYGCRFKANYPNIENHESGCDFQPISCPLGEKSRCSEKLSYKSYYEHITEKHYSFTDINLNEEIKIPLEKNARRYYFIKNDVFHAIFKIEWTIGSSDIVWMVGYLPKNNENDTYYFILTFIDQSGNSRYFKISELCYKLSRDNKSEPIKLTIPKSLFTYFIDSKENLICRISFEKSD